jgi:hypothetical protein
MAGSTAADVMMGQVVDVLASFYQVLYNLGQVVGELVQMERDETGLDVGNHDEFHFHHTNGAWGSM